MGRPNLAANQLIFLFVAGRPLDASDVTDAPVLEPYSAGLRVQGWGGEATWSLDSGALPDGLQLSAGGILSGTPTWLGTSTCTVRATGLPFPDTVGDLTIAVVPGAMEVGIGYERSTRNNMSERPNPLMEDVWMRIRSAGVTELSEHTLDVGLYAAGDDGDFEGGAGDDVRVGDLPGATLTAGAWSAVSGQDAVTDAGGLRLVAGEDTGSLAFTLSHADWPPRTYRAMAVPPDWCPNGEHAGGPWEPGQCE